MLIDILLLLLLCSPSIADDNDFLFNVESWSYCGRGGQCVSSIVCHKVGIDEQNPEMGSMLMSATASESCSLIVISVKA